MATPNYNLPTYETGSIAGFLNASGWNAAMKDIDDSLKTVADSSGGGISQHIWEQYVIVAVIEQGQTTATVTSPVDIDITNSDYIAVSWDKVVTNQTITVSGNDITLTVDTANTATESVSANVTIFWAHV